jgi:nitrite reductase/ring-hydroxylating ferredoxin subunit
MSLLAPLCLLTDLVDGQAKLIASDEAGVIDTKTPGLILLRSGDTVRAYTNLCPHFGVPLAKRQEHLLFKAHQTLSCNNHYARFRWSDGVCEFGDCEGEALTHVAVEIRDGWVVRV